MAVQGESKMPHISGFYALSILWLRRENLKCHERQLEQTAAAIKELICGIQRVLDAAATLITAKRAFAGILANFQFDCLGNFISLFFSNKIYHKTGLEPSVFVLLLLRKNFSRIFPSTGIFYKPLYSFKRTLFIGLGSPSLIWLLPLPSPIFRQQVVSLSQSSYVSPPRR
jgi:hypothetical protein